MAHKVTAPLVVTKREDGSDLYLYHGAVVPDFVKADEVKRLSDEGFIEDVEPKRSAPAKSGDK